MTKQKIVPHLWFDREAKEAAKFYCSVFPDSKITSITTLYNTPSGNTDIVLFEFWGYKFQAISAGPLFQFNPSISFMVNFDPSQDKEARQRIDEVWVNLMEGGKALMPLGEYPFSERYGWVQDRYGLSWQLIYTNPEGEERPLIIPSLLFVGDIYGKAEEASDFYLSVFKNTKRGTIARYPSGMEPDQESMVMFTDFKLEGQWFSAMDSAREHGFNFNEAISFMVFCKDQEENDYYWDKLSAVPEAEQCGWLKDKYGLSWQIVPAVMDKMMQDQDPEKIDRVTQAFLKMKKFDVATLQRAYDGN
ncbi:MAG: VOC family protein [Atribacter sp.]|uniref:VOC family protein n=1 Tax=Atribacter sp. TaxID=2847780 RepID=UPI00175F628D|nr:VOC family protein [Candidatus Atribacteria bacterium]